MDKQVSANKTIKQFSALCLEYTVLVLVLLLYMFPVCFLSIIHTKIYKCQPEISWYDKAARNDTSATKKLVGNILKIQQKTFNAL